MVTYNQKLIRFDEAHYSRAKSNKKLRETEERATKKIASQAIKPKVSLPTNDFGPIS